MAWVGGGEGGRIGACVSICDVEGSVSAGSGEALLEILRRWRGGLGVERLLSAARPYRNAIAGWRPSSIDESAARSGVAVVKLRLH